MDKNKLMELMAAKKQSMKKTEKTTKIEPGENRVVILPGWRAINKDGELDANGDPTWFHDFGQHFIKDAADQIQAVYLCTHATFEKECAVCSALAAATRSAADDATTEVLAKAKASRTVLVNALMLDSKDNPNTPVILELKRGVFEQIVDICLEYEGAPLDPNGAIILKISRDGKGLNTKYTAMPTAKKVKVPSSVLAKVHNLDDYVKQESEEQQRRAIGAINSVAGVLPAPGTGGDRPATSAARLAGPSKGDEFEDIPDFDAAPAKAAAADPALDSELDDLLGNLPE